MSKLIRKSNKGFTLIELMIVVAIIGILAAIAIPNFLRFQLKAKSSEGKVNIAAIRTAEEAYLAEFGSYVAAAALPATVPGTQKGAFTIPALHGFETLGWAPEGSVFFQYAVAARSGETYTISAAADIDGDSFDQAWGYVKTATTGASIVGVNTACAVTGIAGSKFDVVGPCTAASGQSVF
jgi:type IV pilus assembly protein PilA